MTLKHTQVETIVSMREAGVSMEETARRAGCAEVTARRYAREHGLDGARLKTPGAFTGSVAHAKLVEHGFSAFLDNMVRNWHADRFEYVSGYIAYDQPVTIRCLTCGHEIERNAQFARKSRTLVCPGCIDARQTARAEAIVHNRAEAEALRARKEQEREALRARKEQEREASLHKQCIECGESFRAASLQQRICSDACKRRRLNRWSENRRRAQRTQGECDSSINLPDLRRRDHDVCYLCGDLVDGSDYIITGEGHFVVGPSYPSIDHVMPTVHGGDHTWDNVRLAHHSCNTLKRDTLPPLGGC